MVFRNQVSLFRLLLQSSASSARQHFGYYLQLFSGDRQALVSAEQSDPLLQEINKMMSTPRQLRDLCRLTIRSHLAYTARGSGIMCLMSQLPLPRSLISYLGYFREFKDECEDEDEVEVTSREL